MPVPYGFAQGSLNSTFFGNLNIEITGPGLHFLVVSDKKKTEMTRFPMDVGVVQRMEVPPVKKGAEN